MPAFLLFTLQGPLAAWGEIAVGERRAGYDRPSKSAVLGLVAAALGLRRDEEAAHAALHRGYGFAVRVDAPGTVLRDYHTAQVPPAKRGRTFETRREELAADDLNTILSARDYRTDALWTCVLWAREQALHPLEALAEALRRPRFTLYLGRRACPPGLPLGPDVVEADGLAEALAARPAAPPALPEFGWLLRGPKARLYYEPDPPGAEPGALSQVGRRDGLTSRARWQFAERVERQATVDLPAAAPR